jgi:dTDP-4-dehydrorhamnose 3,5-epimerase
VNVIQTKLEGVIIIEPKLFGDQRGFFVESYNQRRYEENGILDTFVQDNHSRSAKGVLRGLHFQKQKPQGKLVQVTHGEVFDVAVDVNPKSKTFSQWVGVKLNSANHTQVYIPPGYAHGFVVISESADFHYKCTEFYDPADEAGIIWNDETINIDWPIKNPILSEKDQKLPTLIQQSSARHNHNSNLPSKRSELRKVMGA